MSISFPRSDIFTTFPVATQAFRLVSRQETSRTTVGAVIGKDLGPALWLADFTSIQLDNDDAVAVEAKLNSLDGVINPFEAGDARRLYPRAHADGVFGDTGVINTIDVSNKAMKISGLDPGFMLSTGDYLAFDYGDPSSRAFHQVMEDVTANGSGLTPLFEVRPHIRPGWVLSPSISVTLKLPKALVTLLPASVSSSTAGPTSSVISFQAAQYLA